MTWCGVKVQRKTDGDAPYTKEYARTYSYFVVFFCINFIAGKNEEKEQRKQAFIFRSIFIVHDYCPQRTDVILTTALY